MKKGKIKNFYKNNHILEGDFFEYANRKLFDTLKYYQAPFDTFYIITSDLRYVDFYLNQQAVM